MSASPSVDSAVVAFGDTLYGIATRHGVAVRELAAWNALAPPYTIHAGERLRLTAPHGAPAIARDSASSPAPPAPAAPKPAPAPTRTAASARPVAPPATAWRWPADGVVLARSAAMPGIDIVGKAGSPVRATADGVVLYSGTGTPGYEELIVVRHINGWVSSYAHSLRRRVAEGQAVKAGAIIADMGRAGVSRDMLHFELRRDGALVDPLTYLPRR
jgi:lipoprotein NlpD